MNKELLEALNILEKEKEISKETLFEAIENSLLTACKNHFGKADNITVQIDRNTCDFLVYATKEIVAMPEDVEDDVLQICLEDAKKISKKAKVGEIFSKFTSSKSTPKGWGSYSKHSAEEFFAEGMAKSLTGKSDSYTKALRKLLKS